MKRVPFVLSVLLSLATFATVASATSLVTVGSGGSFTIDYNACAPCAPPPATDYAGISAQVDFSNFVFTYDSLDMITKVTFDGTIKNTSTLDSRISALAFLTTPDILRTPAPSVTGTFPDVVYNDKNNQTISDGVNFPYGLPNVEFCFIDNTNSCSGGASAGVNKGGTGNISATLYLSGNQTQLGFDAFYLKYQSVDAKNYPTSLGGVGYVPPTPEPASLLLLGSGLSGLALVFRRQR